MSKQVGKVEEDAGLFQEINYSKLNPEGQNDMLQECAKLTGSIMEGVEPKKRDHFCREAKDSVTLSCSRIPVG